MRYLIPRLSEFCRNDFYGEEVAKCMVLMVVAYLIQKSSHWYKILWQPCFNSISKHKEFPNDDYQRLVFTWFLTVIPNEKEPDRFKSGGWPTKQILTSFRPVNENSDFISLLEKVALAVEFPCRAGISHFFSGHVNASCVL